MFKQILNHIFTKKFKVTIVIFIAMMALFTLLRLAFMLANWPQYISQPADEVFYSFIRGLRFDAAGILICNLPVIILYTFPWNVTKYKPVRAVVYTLFFVLNTAAIVLTVADFGYYKTTGRRIVYEIYVMSQDIFSILPRLLIEHYVLLIVLIIFLVVFFAAIRYLYKRLNSRLAESTGVIRSIPVFVLIIFLSTIGIRGGLQMKPMRQANAFCSGNSPLSYLVMNTPYNVLNSLFQENLPAYRFYDDGFAIETSRSIVKGKNETFTDNNYPFMRTRNSNSQSKKLNIVIFIMESWSAGYSGCITGGKTYTPFFDSLARGGMLFTNFFANGQRSIESVPSIFTSVPSLFNASIINSRAELTRYRGMGEILREQGYITSFHHGAATGSMGFDGFSRIAGFELYYGKEDYKDLTEDDYDGMWGVCDEPFFLETEKVINTLEKPFCSVVFSLSSHDPYRIPDKRKDIINQHPGESEFECSVRYSDFSLMQFFNAAEKETWFANTIFIITADHTNYTERPDFYSSFHIPCLIYSPAYVTRGINSAPSSHIDILPTILEVLNINTVHSSMGKSLLSKDNYRYCFVKYNDEFVIISPVWALFNNLEGGVRITDYKTSEELKDPFHTLTEWLNRNLLAYLQVATNVVVRDRIYK